MSYRPDLDADYPFRCDCICGCRDVKWKNGVNHGGKHLCSVCVIREGRGDCDHGTELCPSAQAWKDKFDAMTSGWIKITDDPKTLPKDGEPVWVFSANPDIGVKPRWFRERGERWAGMHGKVVALERGPTFCNDQSIGYYDVAKISHWMPRPIPAPPAAEQTEESMETEKSATEVESVEEYRCPTRKYVGKSSVCNPAHRCDLQEGHDGMHVCDCGKRFKTGEDI